MRSLNLTRDYLGELNKRKGCASVLWPVRTPRSVFTIRRTFVFRRGFKRLIPTTHVPELRAPHKGAEQELKPMLLAAVCDQV